MADSGSGGAPSFTQSNQYLSIKTALDTGSDTFVLTQLEGEEALSRLFLYRVKMFSTNDTITFSDVVGKSATITITLADGTARLINGILTSLELTHFDDRDNVAYYEGEIRPWLWLLTLSGDCKIFQDLAVPDIVTQVCQAAGYSYVTNSLVGQYAQRDYCVQYDESDFNFIARLLEREGIFFYFTHADGQHNLVLGDDASAFKACSSVSTLNYRPYVANDTDDSTLRTVTYGLSVATKTVGVESFNFETPTTSLYSTAQGQSGVGTLSLYTGDFLTSNDGETYATILQQAAQLPAEILRGSGQARTLAAGCSFTLAGHPRTALNQTYVLQRVKIEASRTQYRANFEAFVSTTKYRPPATARLPRMHSTQTAIVVGKQGEEIWVDSYGRIKVQFHWDRVGQNNEKSSCWIRVAQSWAGKAYGNVFTPRIGQEVVVTFLDGDPDRPLVTGAVYNGDQTIPIDMTSEATQSGIKTLSSKNGSGKFNQLRFEDKLNSEEIYVHAQKDLNMDVLNNYTANVTGNYALNVKKGTDDQGNQKGGQRNVLVEAAESNTNQDSYTHSFAKTRALTVTGAETHTNQDAFTQTVSKDYSLTVDGNLTISVSGDVTIKGKTLTLQSTGTTVTVKSSTETDISSGTTMNVKSGTDMSVQSGTGMTLKSSLALNAQGLSVSVKSDTTGQVQAGAILTLKGAMTQIN